MIMQIMVGYANWGMDLVGPNSTLQVFWKTPGKTGCVTLCPNS